MSKIYAVEAGLAEVLRQIYLLPRPALLAISGMSCSGKSTLAGRLQQSLVDEALIVPLDDFFREATDSLLPLDEQGKMIFDLPESYNIPEFVSVINRLLGGHGAVLPSFDKPSALRVKENYRTVNPHPIIIAEGLFVISFLKYLKAPKLLVYVSADTETCVARRVQRDVPIFGTTPERVRKHFAAKVMPFCLHVTRQEKDAQIIISTD